MLGPLGAAFHEFVVDLFFNKDARAGAAALPLIEEEGKMRSLDRLFHVGIGEDDVGALAAEFERHAFEIRFRRRLS